MPDSKPGLAPPSPPPTQIHRIVFGFFILEHVFSRLKTTEEKTNFGHTESQRGPGREMKLFPFVISVSHNDDIENLEVSQEILKLKATLCSFSETKTFCLCSGMFRKVTGKTHTNKTQQPAHGGPTRAGSPGAGSRGLDPALRCRADPLPRTPECTVKVLAGSTWRVQTSVSARLLRWGNECRCCGFFEVKV